MTRRLAYADPPYPGTAGPRYGREEVDHGDLVDHLRTFDAWALSTSASALLDVWNLCPEARCAAWLKTWAHNGWSRVRWSWEPVLFVTDRKGLTPGQASTVWDGLVAAPMLDGFKWAEHTVGPKPAAFVHWLLRLLDFQDGDTLADLFPGSGAVTRFAQAEQLELWTPDA